MGRHEVEGMRLSTGITGVALSKFICPLPSRLSPTDLTPPHPLLTTSPIENWPGHWKKPAMILLSVDLYSHISFSDDTRLLDHATLSHLLAQASIIHFTLILGSPSMFNVAIDPNNWNYPENVHEFQMLY